MAERGFFVVLEGIDNCGKTTQAQFLKAYFEKRGLQTIQSREPGGTAAGEEIREVLLKKRSPMLDPVTQTLLFYASRKEFLNDVVKPNVDRGITVISDRFEASTYVYQGFTQGVDKRFIDGLHRDVVLASGYKPDLYVVLDITAEESFRRMSNDDNQGQELIYEQQGLVFMKKLRQGYIDFAKTQSKRDSSIVLIDGMQDKDKVFQEIVRFFESLKR